MSRSRIPAVACIWVLFTPLAAMAQNLTAILEPADLVEIQPIVPGLLTQLAVNEGDIVDTGALLAQIDDRNQAERVALAEAVAEADGRLQRAAAQIEQAQSLVTRMEDAQKRGAARDWEVEQAQQTLALALADKQIALDGQAQAQAQLSLERAILETYKLRAPFSGVVLEISENVGANVDTQTVVLTLAQLSTLEATAFVPLTWLDTLAAGDTMGARVEGTDVDVRVTSIDPRVDPASQTVRLRLSLENTDESFRPGTTLELLNP